MPKIPAGLITKLADAEHASWSRWMKYLFSVSQTHEDGSITIPSSYAKRWQRQADTEFSSLTAAEQASDIKEVERILPLIEAL